MLFKIADAQSWPPWAPQLAGILPLSALIDFLDVPRNLHIFELTGRMPLWCWTITPSGSRLLLADRGGRDVCCLDRFECGPKRLCIDGRYGDKYTSASGGTLEMCLEGCKTPDIPNTHPNVEAEMNRRPQLLEVITVKRTTALSENKKPFSWDLARCCASWRPSYGTIYLAATVFGWAVWIALTVVAIIVNCWMAAAFLLVVVLSGISVLWIFGGKPRRLGERGKSPYNRLVLSAYHMNSLHWRVFIGESTIVNSLLNWPLLQDRRDDPHRTAMLALRALILCQWALAIGAAAEQGLDAYIIAFWIIFCIPLQSWVFSSGRGVRSWLQSSAKIDLERCSVALSSRRALINAVMALNPDTFAETPEKDAQGIEKLDDGALLWVDGILKPGAARGPWQEATRHAMSEVRAGSGTLASLTSVYEAMWWWKFVVEGIEVADLVGREMGLQGRLV